MWVFYPAETSPSSIAQAENLSSVPALIYSGTQDGVTPPQNHQDPIYDNWASPSKIQVYIEGGGHCYFADTQLACDFGELLSPPGPSITREKQQQITLRYLVPFLHWKLNGLNPESIFDSSIDNDHEVSYRINCLTTGTGMVIPKRINVHSFRHSMYCS